MQEVARSALEGQRTWGWGTCPLSVTPVRAQVTDSPGITGATQAQRGSEVCAGSGRAEVRAQAPWLSGSQVSAGMGQDSKEDSLGKGSKGSGCQGWHALYQLASPRPPCPGLGLA